MTTNGDVINVGGNDVNDDDSNDENDKYGDDNEDGCYPWYNNHNLDHDNCDDGNFMSPIVQYRAIKQDYLT